MKCIKIRKEIQMALDLNNLYRRREQIAFEMIEADFSEAQELQQELEEIEMEIEAYADFNPEITEEMEQQNG